MDRCEAVQAALLEDDRAPMVEAHLVDCEACRAVASAHRGAVSFAGASPRLVRRRSTAAVQNRAVALVVFLSAAGGAVGWWQGARSTVPVVAVVPAPETPVQTIAPEPADPAPELGLVALAELQWQVEADASRDVRDDALATRLFGPLAGWVNPRRTQPLRSLGRAASPVIYTSEDSP